MVSAVTGLISLFGNLGVGNFLLHKQERIREYATAAFWLNGLLGAGIALLCFASAPLTAGLFHIPRLADLQRALASLYLLTALGAVPMALLQKKLRFGKMGSVYLISALAGFCLTVFLALRGFGVWSFVIPAIFTAGLQTVLFWVLSGWRPECTWRLDLWRDIFHYGKHIFGADLNTYLLLHLDFLIIGKFLGMEILGLYKFSFSLATALSVIFIDITARIMTPSFALLQEKREAMQQAVLRTLSYLAFIAFPLFLGLLVTADIFIPAIYGGKWVSAIFPFQIFTILSLAGVLAKPSTSILNAIGKPEIRYHYSLVFIPVTILAVFLSLPAGLAGVSIAYTVCVSLLSLALLRKSLGLIGLGPGKAVETFVSSAIASVVMALSCMLLKYFWNSGKEEKFLFLLVAIALGSLVYTVMRFLFFRRETRMFLDACRGRGPGTAG